MKVKLNIGYVATAITPYYSNEYKVREKSEIALKKLLSSFDVNFIPFNKTIFSTKDAVEAEKFFKDKIAVKYNGIQLKVIQRPIKKRKGI